MPTFLCSRDGGTDILVGRLPLMVGRHALCDARLDSLRVSRRHCMLIETDGAVHVRDLGSTNGTRVNGLRVESGWLRPGDELEVAHVRYRVTAGRDRFGPAGGFVAVTLAATSGV